MLIVFCPGEGMGKQVLSQSPGSVHLYRLQRKIWQRLLDFFLLAYNCFIMCQFLLYNEVNQLYVYIYPLPLGPLSHIPLPHPTHLGHHRAPVLYSRFPQAIYFTHGSVCMSNLISQFIPPSPSPPRLPLIWASSHGNTPTYSERYTRPRFTEHCL